MGGIAKPDFPDRALTRDELARSAKGLPLSTQTFYFDESWHRTERVSVEAADEDEAWAIYQSGAARYVSTVFDDECVDTMMLAPGDADYPDDEMQP